MKKYRRLEQHRPLSPWEVVKIEEMTFEEAATAAYKLLSPAISEFGQGEAFEARFGTGIHPGNWTYVPTISDN